MTIVPLSLAHDLFRKPVPAFWDHAPGNQEDAMTFRIRGLEAGQFAHLFALPDAVLAAYGGLRKIADGPHPCRISLTDAVPGDEVILVNYEHHAVASPYRMRFAIYVREGEQTFDAVGAVPDQLRRRTLAVRGFDGKGMMTGWEIIEGIWLEEAIERQLADPAVQYLHIHFAAPGCYAAKVERA
jgi:Protein of unknown function (DUF1203)